MGGGHSSPRWLTAVCYEMPCSAPNCDSSEIGTSKMGPSFAVIAPFWRRNRIWCSFSLSRVKIAKGHCKRCSSTSKNMYSYSLGILGEKDIASNAKCPLIYFNFILNQCLLEDTNNKWRRSNVCFSIYRNSGKNYAGVVWSLLTKETWNLINDKRGGGSFIVRKCCCYSPAVHRSFLTTTEMSQREMSLLTEVALFLLMKRFFTYVSGSRIDEITNNDSLNAPV